MIGMASTYPSAHPEILPILDYWREDGQMVPVATNGEFQALASCRYLDRIAPDEHIAAADYVVGLELLGFCFTVQSLHRDGRLTLCLCDPLEALPETWERHSLSIMKAFGSPRDPEAIDFILKREATR